MTVEFIRELDDYGALKGGSACLVKRGDEFFVISHILNGPEGGGPETLAFASNEDGEVSDWTDLAGGRGKSREDAIRELEEVGPDADCAGRGAFGDTKPTSERTVGDALSVLASTMDAMAGRSKP